MAMDNTLEPTTEDGRIEIESPEDEAEGIRQEASADENLNEETPAAEDKAEENPDEAEADSQESAGENPEDSEACDEESCGCTEEDTQESEDAEEQEASEENSEEAENQEASEEDAKEEKTGFFGRRKKDKEKEKLEKQLEDLGDKLKRSLAEFDNFRKRTEKEKAANYMIGARDVVEKILPVVDNFERGLSNAPEGDAFADGMKMIYKQLETALEELGVQPIEAVGKEFDPNLHNAVMHVDDEEAGENVVVEEFQKGYTYKDFVVRHSMVKVAN